EGLLADRLGRLALGDHVSAIGDHHPVDEPVVPVDDRAVLRPLHALHGMGDEAPNPHDVAPPDPGRDPDPDLAEVDHASSSGVLTRRSRPTVRGPAVAVMLSAGSALARTPA